MIHGRSVRERKFTILAAFSKVPKPPNYMNTSEKSVRWLRQLNRGISFQDYSWFFKEYSQSLKTAEKNFLIFKNIS